MRVIPVLDVMGGVVVRGVAGRRSEYRPIQSGIVDSCEPLAIAKAFRERFGLTTLYLADLDAIGGGAPALATYRELRAHGFQLWIDAGVSEPGRASAVIEHGRGDVVIGMETVASPALVNELAVQFADRAIFSLDLRGDTPLGDLRPWRENDPRALAVWAMAKGIRRLLVLDLSRVGVDRGIGTENLCGHLATHYPGVAVYAGGGVRDRDDLHALERLGVRAVLVASALHDGRLTRADLDRL